jgi:hypothetical protein
MKETHMKNNKKTRTLMALGASFAMMGTASAAAIYAAWDLNEGSGTTTTQYQRGSLTWNQVDNPNENLAATASENFTGIAAWAAASPAPKSTASLTFNATGGVNQLDTNVSGTGLAGTGAKTFLAWINPTGLDSTGSGILSYSPSGGANNGQDLRFLLNPNGDLRVEVNGSGFAYDSDSLVNDGWKMVAAVFDNTNGTSIYIGGQGFVATQSLSFNTTATASNDGITDIVLGGTQVGTRSFIGGIDMAAVYTGALTEAELNNIYANGIAIPEPSTIVLLGIALGSMIVMRRR